MHDDEQLDITKLKYVLYVRKSTDDPERQIRTLDDQIDECKAMAKRLGINIVEIIQERKSAKKPGLRRQFTNMINDIRVKKYDAILAWHPDRLARNMVEGGEIIDMVDNAVIKDLKFVTYHFTPDPQGKMMLGMAFVMSKQYSDKLSVDVTRGVRKSFQEGKSSGSYKHGYIRDEDGYYRPNGNNFILIKEAWKLRQQGKPLVAIAEYMNSNGYVRTFKKGAKKAQQQSYMTDKILSALVFPDPFYYGVLMQKKQQVDLRTISGYDFIPATDETTYNYVQSLTGRRAPTERKRSVFKPLKGMVICAYCQRTMYPQTPLSGRKSEQTRILSYRCDTVSCSRRNRELGLPKSVRAKVIFGFMYTALDGLRATEQDYKAIYEHLIAKAKSRRQESVILVHAKQAELKQINRDINERSLKIINLDPKSPIYTANENHINNLVARRDKLNNEIKRMQQGIADPQQSAMGFQKFLNVANNASKHLRAADVATKDRIARLIYLNVTVNGQNVVDYQMRKPFSIYFEMPKIVSGGDERT